MFLHQFQKRPYLCVPLKQGLVAEWLRHSSAKAATAVRIRSRPPDSIKPAVDIDCRLFHLFNRLVAIGAFA